MSTLRADKLQTLAGTSKDIAKLVDDSTIVDRASFSSDAEFNAAKPGKISLDAQKRTRSTSFIAGTEEVSGATARDAFIVGRNVTGFTDCHAFADRTVMSDVGDAGTYGAFDATTILRGTNTQNHMHAFQDRQRYEGDGILSDHAGYLSIPEHAGTGTIAERKGVDIHDITVTGDGEVQSNIGILIRDLAHGMLKVAVNIAQNSGWGVYAPGGGARHYFAGNIGVGLDNDQPVQLLIANGPASAKMFLNSVPSEVQFGAIGNHPVSVYSGAALCLQVADAAGQHAVRPGADNSQPLGGVSRRWSQLYAGTATISTSDAREKTAVRHLSAAEIAAAKDLAKEMGAFRFLSAVAEKGEAAREHIGMTVQRAIEVLESHGLDPFGYSFICYDEWDAQPEVRNTETGAVEREAVAAGNRYSFRFEGLLAFIAAGFEARLAALESLQG